MIEKVPDVKVPKEQPKAPLAAPELSTSSAGGAAEPPPDPSVSPRFLDAFDRGLIKRQSKGKYQVGACVEFFKSPIFNSMA